jgi:hypothetical protein
MAPLMGGIERQPMRRWIGRQTTCDPYEHKFGLQAGIAGRSGNPSGAGFRPQLKEIRVLAQRVNRLFTIMKKGLRTDFGPRQSAPSISKRRLQGTRRFLRSNTS